MKLKTSVCILIFFIFASQDLVAQEFQADSVLFNPAIKHGKLKNGLQYYILNEARPDKTISFNLVVKVGYPDEERNQLGIAHLIEHIAFRSTKNFPTGTRNFLLSNGGLSNSFNAATANETRYFFKIGANNKEFLKTGLLVLRDIAADVSFLPQEVNEERSAVEKEMLQGTSKTFLAYSEIKNKLLNNRIDHLKKNAFEIKTVKETPVEEIRLFYKNWYRPDNQALIVVGDLNEEEVEREIKLHFSDLINNDTSKLRVEKKNRDVQLDGINKVFIVKNTVGSAIQIDLYKLRKGETNAAYPSTLKELRTSVLDELINTMIRNRIMVLARSEEALLQGITQAIQRNTPSSGVDAFQSQASLGSVAEIKPVLVLMIREMKRLKEYGFSKVELDRAKLNYFNSQHKQTSFELMLIYHYGYGSAVPANENLLKKELAKKIELQEINAALTHFLGKNDDLKIALSIPQGTKSKLLTVNALLNLVDEAWNSNVERYLEKIVKEPKLPRLNRTGIEKYVVNDIPKLKATEIVLQNGIKVILKTLPPNKQNGVDIMLGGFKFYEPNKALWDALPVLNKLNNFIVVGSLNSPEFSAWKEYQGEMGFTLSASPYIGAEESGIIGSSKTANAETLFQLISAYFKTASVDRDAFRKSLDAAKAAMLTQRNRPRTFDDSIHVVVHDDPGYNKIQTSDFTALSADDIFQIYKDKFTYSDGYSFVITGSFDKNIMIDLVVRYLGSLPSSNNKFYPHIKKNVDSLSPSSTRLNHRAVMIGDSIGNVDVRILFKGPKSITILDRMKLKLLREIIGQNLFVRLREKDKGVYGVSAEIQSGKNESDFYLDIGFQTAPADVDRLVRSVQDELNRLSSGELVDSIFQNALREVRSRVSQDMNSPFYWNSYISRQIRQGSYSNDALKSLELLDTITPKDVSQAMGELFNLKDYALFKLL